jgi:hypothetical protein
MRGRRIKVQISCSRYAEGLRCRFQKDHRLCIALARWIAYSNESHCIVIRLTFEFIALDDNVNIDDAILLGCLVYTRNNNIVSRSIEWCWTA